MTQPRDSGAEYRLPADPDGAAAALLAEARQRAEEIIEDSLLRAEELLRPQRPEAGYERVRLAIVDVGDEVRSIRFRLDAIEALLGRPAGSAAPPPPVPASAVPPWVEPPVAPAWPAPAPAAPPWVEPSAAPPPAAPGFQPADGAITLRVSPVAGFQGLMRIQDALVRLHGVHEAGVEAYAQGEARLRLHLSDRLEPQRLADGLADLLGHTVRVAATSLPERTIHLALD